MLMSESGVNAKSAQREATMRALERWQRAQETFVNADMAEIRRLAEGRSAVEAGRRAAENLKRRVTL